ncbi:MAG: TolC family protein [Bacteroidales bacterium]|nr:TolC family protein [Bacteroidales bacterium]
MKFLNKILLYAFFLICLTHTTLAQKTVLPEDQSFDPASAFPPMRVMIDSAIKKNALVRYRDQEIDSKQYNLKTQQTSWTKNVGIQADTRYGTFDNFSTNTAEGQNPSILATKTSQFNYGVGAYVKVPFYDIFNHKNQINQAKTELSQAESMAEAQRDEVTRMVITQYNNLIMKQRLLTIKSINLESSKINMEMGEKEFKTGVINLSEYVRISDIVSRAESDYEAIRADFITAYMLLEELTGMKFNIYILNQGNEGN